MKLTRAEFKYLKESKKVPFKDFPFRRNLLRRKRPRTILELLQGESLDNEYIESPTYWQQTALNNSFLQASSVEEIQDWIAENS